MPGSTASHERDAFGIFEALLIEVYARKCDAVAIVDDTAAQTVAQG